jgi:hypothetical protein
VEGNVPVDSDALLVTDFVNLKIEPAQSFGGAHRDRLCVCVHSGECSYVYKYLCLYCVSKKNVCSGFDYGKDMLWEGENQVFWFFRGRESRAGSWRETRLWVGRENLVTEGKYHGALVFG